MRFRKFWSWVVWRIIPVPNPRTAPFCDQKHLVVFWEVGTVKKSADQKSFSTSGQMKDGSFSNEIRRGEVKEWSLKLTQSLPCEKWKERELYTFLFGDLRNLTIWIILLNILYILTRYFISTRSLHAPTKYTRKQKWLESEMNIHWGYPGALVWFLVKKRVYFFWVIHTVFDQELCSFSSYESPSSLPFPERKNKCMEMPQQQKKHPQQLIRKFKRVPFLKELLRFLAAYRAVEGFTREEWINCFFLWVSGKGGVLFFSQSFSGWLGVGGLGFQNLLLADFETLNDIYNFIRLTFSDKIITCTVSVYYSSFWKHLFLLTCQFVMTWNAWAFRTLIRNRMIPRKMPGTFKIHKSLQSEVTPPKNKHVPWKIVIGRLLSFWHGPVLRDMEFLGV